jgi:hypothetical protein
MLATAHKLCKETEKGWYKLNGFKPIPLIKAGIRFGNGEQVNDAAA